jgi:uncharacterized protein
MRVTITGATGLIGPRLVALLRERGDEVTILSRNPDAGERWDPAAGPAPAGALAGRDAVVHLAGERLDQRWSDDAKRRMTESRTTGTRNLVAGIRAADPRPRALVSASAVGYYGPRGDERVTEDEPPGDDFLARLCADWEREAQAAERDGLRVVRVRAGVVLDRRGGALGRMLLPFRLGVGGPVAGGRQYLPWIHVEDVAGVYARAVEDERWSGPVNACAPEPVTNAEFSKALGRALRRPAVLPIPSAALKLLYGERTLALGYELRHPELDEALRSALA